MVWGAISPKAKLNLIFIDKGVKLNAKYYLEEVFVGNFSAHVSSMLRDSPNCFQQDSAPIHKARISQQRCKDNKPSLISADEWPLRLRF